MKENRIIKNFILCSLILAIYAGKGNAASAYQGYTMYASGTTAYLVDMSGNTLHTWKSSKSVVVYAYLLEDGSVLFPINNNCSVRRDGAFPSGRFQKISWDGTVTWDFTFCNSTYTPGYDIEPMSNGNILIPADNSSSAGAIFEIQPSGTSGGNIVWQYVLPDSLNKSGTYINSISYNPDLDMILVDLQTPNNKLVVIDHSQSTGRVVFTYNVGSSGRVHAAKWITKYFLGTKTVIPDADTNAMRINNLLVVNNSSRAVEVNMTTKQLVKSFTYSFANNEGSVQRLPNGNTLVHKGNSQTVIEELDSDGKSIATITAKGRCSRAYRYGSTYAGVSKLNSGTICKTVISNFIKTKCVYNAALNGLQITLSDPNETNVKFRIVTIDGKTLYSKILSGMTNCISVRNLQTGVYFAELQSSSGSLKAQFVKE